MLSRAVAHLRRADPALARVIVAVGPFTGRPDRRGGTFAALVQSILYQQLAGSAARAILKRLRKAVGRRYPRPQDIAALTDAELRAVGLSRQKIGYLRDLTERARNGLPLRGLSRRSDEAVIEALTAVKGVGRWTVEMLLMFRFRRPDVLPVDDYGLRTAMKRAFRLRELPNAAWIRRRGERWRPYRSLACWYLWRSLELPVKTRPRRGA